MQKKQIYLEEMENKFPAIINNSINIKGVECLSTRDHNNIGNKRNIQRQVYYALPPFRACKAQGEQV